MTKLINKLKNRINNLNESNKNILYNTIGAFTIRGAALFVSLYTMPAYLRYFDDQLVLGLWFTMVSVLSWILTFDLGIGNGLRNHLVTTLVNKDNIGTKKYISSAYVVVGSIVSIVLILSTIFFRFIDWNTFFNISKQIVTKETLSLTVFIVFTGIMLQFATKLITSILYAMQRSALNNLLSLLSSIIILVYVSLAKSSNISINLISLALVNVLAVNIPYIIATILVFTKKLKGCKPELKFFDKKYAKNVLKLGGMFFIVQITYMIITATNEFLITWLASPDKVVEYQIYNKLFLLIGTIFTLALTPIWSAVTKAVSEENFTWIKKLYRSMIMLTLVAVVCEFAMILFLQVVMNFWLGENAIQVNYVYAIIFAISGSIFIWNAVISSMVNGFGKLKVQSILFTFGAIINIPLAWFLVGIFESWIGVIVANILAMSLYCIIQPIMINKYLKDKG
ncbi:MAG: polysaccharide biosynthesis protein [Fusobacteria bacterium]|nr:MAG: polysaccharide biosynthesis protein [Fusobacteriota bacterium]KAF0229253.1 MAG: polysaccharide biosynthesis [Fusobacteriota bacterium]